MTLLLPMLGALVLLWSLVNLLITTFTSGSFAALLIHFYDHKKIPTSPELFGHTGLNQKKRTISPLSLLCFWHLW